jgi:DNA-binding MarR family transcriptional regulator
MYDRLAEVGASGYEYRVLSTLQAVGETTQAELGRIALLDRRDVTVTVRALIESGAIARRRSAHDARAQAVSLTRVGRQRYAQLNRLMQAAQEDVLGPISEPSRGRLLDDLARLVSDARTPNAEAGDRPS